MPPTSLGSNESERTSSPEMMSCRKRSAGSARVPPLSQPQLRAGATIYLEDKHFGGFRNVETRLGRRGGSGRAKYWSRVEVWEKNGSFKGDGNGQSRSGGEGSRKIVLGKSNPASGVVGLNFLAPAGTARDWT